MNKEVSTDERKGINWSALGLSLAIVGIAICFISISPVAMVLEGVYSLPKGIAMQIGALVGAIMFFAGAFCLLSPSLVGWNPELGK